MRHITHSQFGPSPAGLLAGLLTAAVCAQAQEGPHIGYVYPAGCRRGVEIEVAVGGQFLNGVTGALISGKGIQAMVSGYDRPRSAAEMEALRRRRLRLQMLREQAMQAATQPSRRDPFEALARDLGLSDPNETIPHDANEPLDEKALDEAIRVANSKKQLNPQLAETVTLYLTVAPDAQPGVRELRLVTPAGLSNPIAFRVGTWEEYCEHEPNDKSPDSRVPRWLPIIINGQTMPGDVDRFKVWAGKGTRLVAAVSARKLMPYLADAVPGWFQATLALLDEEGNQLAYADDFRFDPDPVLYYQVPRDGYYVLEIKDALYRGREDFVYRIALGEAEFITGIFPLGGRVGTTTTVAASGMNLLSDTMAFHGSAEPGILSVCLSGGRQITQCVPFHVDMLPEQPEQGRNDDRPTAQPLQVPVIVNGRVDSPGDCDFFRVTGRAGDQFVAEVLARRLGSPLDSLLELLDEDGRLLMVNDDHEDPAAGLTTHHADSRLDVKLPRDGTYYLRLADTQSKGGPAYAYRLRIARPRPDFELRVVPASVNARAGTTVPITVFALRKDGFQGDIKLKLTQASLGFTLSGGWVPAGQDKSIATLTMPMAPRRGPVKLGMEGQATIDQHQVRRPAEPAEDMMQAFAYRHLVLATEWLVCVSGSRVDGLSVRLLGDVPVRIPPGGTAEVRFSMRPGSRGTAGQILAELHGAPDGITISKVTTTSQHLAITLAAEAGKAKPGLKGNLLAEAYREWMIKDTDGKPTGNMARSSLGALPAIPFEIPPAPAAEAGEQTPGGTP